MNLSTLVLGIFTIVQLNCENLFDCKHDSLKNDYEFLPTSYRHWNPHKYWCKMNHLSQSLVWRLERELVVARYRGIMRGGE